VARRLKLALEAEQHDVFFDRNDLGAGDAYQQAIREALAAADLLVFLVAPESVGAGSYALTELGLAEAKWSRPAGRVLPVVAAARSSTASTACWQGRESPGFSQCECRGAEHGACLMSQTLLLGFVQGYFALLPLHCRHGLTSIYG